MCTDKGWWFTRNQINIAIVVSRKFIAVPPLLARAPTPFAGRQPVRQAATEASVPARSLAATSMPIGVHRPTCRVPHHSSAAGETPTIGAISANASKSLEQ
jgi:hypothetical protein